jgi:hypothetical protein
MIIVAEGVNGVVAAEASRRGEKEGSEGHRTSIEMAPQLN